MYFWSICIDWRRRQYTYLLTPWSRVFIEKLTGFQLVKKFPAFYGSRRFLTTFTSARHLYLSWASSTQSIPPHSPSWRSILLLSSHLSLRLPSGLFASGFPTKTLNTSLLSPICATCPTHPNILDFITRYKLGEEYWSLRFSLCRLGQYIRLKYWQKTTKLHRHITGNFFKLRCMICLVFSCINNELSQTYIFREHFRAAAASWPSFHFVPSRALQEGFKRRDHQSWFISDNREVSTQEIYFTWFRTCLVYFGIL